MLQKFIFLLILTVKLATTHTHAQTFQEPKDIDINPSHYPPLAERKQVMDWATHPNNHQTKIYSKADFEAHTLDDRVQIEAYGYYIVYEGSYLCMAEIQAYEARKAQIVSRSYSDYKNYLMHHNLAHYYELFGN